MAATETSAGTFGKAEVDESFHRDEPREIRLYGIPLMALAKAEAKRTPAERQAAFDSMIRGGGYSRRDYIRALRAGVATEQDPGVRRLARDALSALSARPPAKTSEPARQPERRRSSPRSRSRRGGGSRITRAGPDDDSPSPLAHSPARAGRLGVEAA